MRVKKRRLDLAQAGFVVAVCDLFLEAFVKSFVLFLGLIRRQIQAGLLSGNISEIAQDRGLSLRFGHGFDLL